MFDGLALIYLNRFCHPFEPGVGVLFIGTKRNSNIIVVLDKPNNKFHQQVFYHLIMTPKVIGMQSYKAVNFTMVTSASVTCQPPPILAGLRHFALFTSHEVLDADGHPT